MSISDKTKKSLEKIGLTSYEIRAYTTLIKDGESNASEISQNSGVPYSKIYEILGTLEEKGWIGSYDSRLQQIAPGVIWIMALLSVLLSSESLFDEDYRDGSLEQMIITPNLLFMAVLGKITAHWLTKSLPIAIASPLMGLLLSISPESIFSLMIGLIIGTACFTLLGGVGAALTVATKDKSFLLALIIMPLYVPIIIFGSSMIYYRIDGMDWSYPLAALLSIFCMLTILSPLSISGIFRSSMVE